MILRMAACHAVKSQRHYSPTLQGYKLFLNDYQGRAHRSPILRQKKQISLVLPNSKPDCGKVRKPVSNCFLSALMEHSVEHLSEKPLYLYTEDTKIHLSI